MDNTTIKNHSICPYSTLTIAPTGAIKPFRVFKMPLFFMCSCQGRRRDINIKMMRLQFDHGPVDDIADRQLKFV